MNRVIKFKNPPSITHTASVVGKEEGKGPLAHEFDEIYDDATFGEDSWEKAESTLQKKAIEKVIEKSGRKKDEIDLLFAGDLLNQCTGSTFGIRDLSIPFAGMYGACSTMALTLATASVFIASGAASVAIAATSSHFCSSEKQFRFPLEYGGQRTPTAQRTCTAAGASMIEKSGGKVLIDSVIFGKIQDLGITDANNMGAAMAPAAADTISQFLKSTKTTPDDYDLILTGDLGFVGSELLTELLMKDHNLDISSVHNDCGKMMFYREGQDVHAGGSGCGCSASILNSHIYRQLCEKELEKVLFVATGALLSPTSTMQGESIPGIAHGILLKGKS
ncbi:MAG: stage V sporulation protein AD [Ruminococcaceae bacterium]|nr:stage V sporulation protein AD [Oscillospiraceae bacterium]